MKRPPRLLTLLLRLYPEEFRSAHEEEILSFIEEESSLERGGVGFWTFTALESTPERPPRALARATPLRSQGPSRPLPPAQDARRLFVLPRFPPGSPEHESNASGERRHRLDARARDRPRRRESSASSTLCSSSLFPTRTRIASSTSTLAGRRKASSGPTIRERTSSV